MAELKCVVMFLLLFLVICIIEIPGGPGFRGAAVRRAVVLMYEFCVLVDALQGCRRCLGPMDVLPTGCSSRAWCAAGIRLERRSWRPGVFRK